MRTLALVLLFAARSAVSAATPYSVHLAAGSDWVGDDGPSRDSLLLQADGVAAGIDGNLFISDAQTHRVREITATGVIRTVAGTGLAGLSGDGGLAVNAQLRSPYGLAVDAAGNLYIADLGNARIRRVGRDGKISTVAGLPDLISPRNVAVDSAGVLYVADFDGNRVYKIPAPGLSTVVSTGTLNHPAAIVVDRAGALYIGDTGTHSVRKVDASGTRVIAQISAPTGMAFDAGGNLYVADAAGSGVWKIPAAGSPTVLPYAAFDVTIAADGSMLVTDGRLVRRVTGTTSVVIAGRGDPARGDFGPATDARLNNPSGVAVDRNGQLYIADRDNHRVRRVDAQGIITTFAGTGLAGDAGDGGSAAIGTLNQPSALSFDDSGNLYINDAGAHRIRAVTSAGVIYGVDKMPDGTITDAALRAYFIDATYRVGRTDRAGVVEYLQLDADIGLPTSLTVTADGTVYVTDIAGDRVWQLSPVVTAPAPVVQVDLVNSASLEPGPLAPGMLVTLRGLTLQSPEILFGSPAATILTATAGQLVAVVPTQVPLGPVEVEIRDGGAAVRQISATIVSATPALFTNSDGHAVALNQDGSLNSANAPAARGSVVMLYGTGQGVSGASVSAHIGLYSADVLYSGPVAGYPGLWQINVRVPAGFLAPGSLPVTLNVGDSVSASAVLDVF